MNNFIFKSPRGLVKNSSIHDLDRLMNILLGEQRHQRSDLHDIKLMLNKLLINKHLENQADKYFDEDGHTILEDMQQEDKEPD